MKNFILLLIIVSFTSTFAQSTHKEAPNKSDGKKESVRVLGSDKIWNKICPVMGEEVNPKVKTISYKGTVIGFCCNKCVKKFLSNPSEYLNNLSKDGQSFIGKKEAKTEKK